jgi:hypothetical protein
MQKEIDGQAEDGASSEEQSTRLWLPPYFGECVCVYITMLPLYLQGDKMEDQEEQLVLMVKETNVPQTNPYNLSTNSSKLTEEVPVS